MIQIGSQCGHCSLGSPEPPTGVQDPEQTFDGRGAYRISLPGSGTAPRRTVDGLGTHDARLRGRQESESQAHRSQCRGIARLQSDYGRRHGLPG